MDFSSLFRKDTNSDRRLKGKSGGSSSGKESTDKSTTATTEAEAGLKNITDFDKYLLSDQHLDISVKSSGEEDESKLQFNWYAKEITGTEISIQLLF
jgi:hypothetical protein